MYQASRYKASLNLNDFKTCNASLNPELCVKLLRLTKIRCSPMFLQTEHEIYELALIHKYVIPIGIALIAMFIGLRLLKLIDFYSAIGLKRPLCNHMYFRLKKLTAAQRFILINNQPFYNKLSKTQQRHFEHRLVHFIDKVTFVGKDNLVVTEKMKVLIAATATMLTFGFRRYLLSIIKTVLMYPKPYYSSINETYHKGETNPKFSAIVFSWEDFERGYSVGNDNLNLGIHEFGHAIHLNAAISKDLSSVLFNRGFDKLTSYLKHNESVRQQLIASKYFRSYAYTNQFEFFAVLLENFIETPKEFKAQFPVLYKTMRDMLNFKFAGY